jgi:hypothetical protein
MTEIKAIKEFFESMISLSLNFAFNWTKEHLEENVIDVLVERSNLCELLLINDKNASSEWFNFLNLTEEHYSRKCTAEYFEKDLTQWIMPFALTRFEMYYKRKNDLLKDYNAGSIKYDRPLAELPANYCNFHIANAVSPQSIFDEYDYLPKCFLELMDKSEREYGYNTLRTFTWLNSHPKWLALFPPEWDENMSEPDNQVFNNLGYWGQLVNARGSINRKMEDYVRTHGTIKYKPRRSHCSFAAMREHLNKYLSEDNKC